jgi:cyclic nucleotide gated channel, plant
VATCGVDEEALLSDLLMDICRDIKPHLCLDLIRQAPLFNEMDGQLRPALHTWGMRLVRKLDPMDFMLFNTHGYLDTHRAQAGQSTLAEASKENMSARSVGGGSRSGG